MDSNVLRRFVDNIIFAMNLSEVVPGPEPGPRLGSTQELESEPVIEDEEEFFSEMWDTLT